LTSKKNEDGGTNPKRQCEKRFVTELLEEGKQSPLNPAVKSTARKEWTVKNRKTPGRSSGKRKEDNAGGKLQRRKGRKVGGSKVWGPKKVGPQI